MIPGRAKPITFFILLFIKVLLFIHAQETMDIRDCIDAAQLNNIGIIAENITRQDDWRKLNLQKRLFFPELSVAFSRSDSVTVNAPDSRIKSLGLSINQLLFNGGRSLSDYRSAVRELELRDLSAQDMSVQIAFRVILEYVNMLKSREILKVQKQSLVNLGAQLEVAELEYTLGELTESDLLDMRVQTLQHSLNIRDSEEMLLQSLFNLSELMNMKPGDLAPLTGSLNMDYQSTYALKIMKDSTYIAVLSDKAELFNKELMAQYLKIIKAERDLLDSKIIWMPKIEASGDLNITGPDYPLSEVSFSFGLDFTFMPPLFPGSLSLNAGKSNPREHNISLSSETSVLNNLEAMITPSTLRNQLDIKQMEIEELKRNIIFTIDLLAQSIVLNQERCSLNREKIHMETEKLNIEKIRVEMGELTRLDYVKSELRLADYRRELIESIAALFSDEIELEMSCGLNTENRDVLFRNLIITEVDAP